MMYQHQNRQEGLNVWSVRDELRVTKSDEDGKMIMTERCFFFYSYAMRSAELWGTLGS